MKIEEVLRVLCALRDGKKIRRRSFEFLYAKFKDGKYVIFDQNGVEAPYTLNETNIMSENWEIVEEPNQKVKYYPALLENKSEKYLSLYKYRNLNHALDCCSSETITVIRLITEIPELIEERDE